MTSQVLAGIAQILVSQNLIEHERAATAQKQATANNTSFLDYVIKNHILSAKDIALTCSKYFGVPFLDLDEFDPNYFAVSQIKEDLISRYQILPLFKRGDHLYIAVADPSKQVTLNEIKFLTGLHVHSVSVEFDKLTRIITNNFEQQAAVQLKDYLEGPLLDDFEINAEEKEEDFTRPINAADDAPIVRFVHKILIDAIKQGASDIHFEPYDRNFRIRYRIDGILYEVSSPPINLANRISSRLKVMSNIDISERRLPQDGRCRLKLSRQHSIDFRVSSCPTVNGEKIVMRIVEAELGNLNINTLGFNEYQKQVFTGAIKLPQGMILVTGPTGSGKSVTMYTALSILNTAEQNIVTIEDPVEIKIPGLNQVNINTKSGLTFSNALRSFLRQDPDIIMVGEIRDTETAEIAIKAAQTGHLVLSTLHTNSAAETITRLLNMGIATYNITSSVSLIIAQRLARKLCEDCKEATLLPQDLSAQLNLLDEKGKPLTIYRAVGCPKCMNGYRGRVGFFELLLVSKKIGEIILQGSSAAEIARQATLEGMIPLREAGLEKVKLGLTSIEEINRVIRD